MTDQNQYDIWENQSMDGSDALKGRNFDGAESHYLEALAIAKEIAKEGDGPLDLLLLAVSYSQIGDVYREKGDLKAAIHHYDAGISEAQQAIDAVPPAIARLAGIQEYEKNLGILYLKSSFCFGEDERERQNRLFWATKIFEKIHGKADCGAELDLCHRLQKQLEMD